MTHPTHTLVRDDGFYAEDLPDETPILDLASDTAPDALDRLASSPGTQIPVIRITFPSSADGRGFTLARLLRLHGYRGRLRAAGHVLSDQYAMARRSGFDEVEIDAALADRQSWPQWRFRADWQTHDYQARMRG